MNPLLSLAERVEKAEVPSQNLDAVIHEAVTSFAVRRAGVGWPDEGAPVVPAFPGWKPLPAYTASLDAAMSLVPEGFSRRATAEFTEHDSIVRGWSRVSVTPVANGFTFVKESIAATPALALTAACLRARACDSGSDAKRGDPSGAPAVGSQSGDCEAGASPKTHSDQQP